MNTPILERYPFDYTGEAITNLVEGELHVIPPGKKDRIFTLLEGPGFSDSIKLFKGDGTPLTPWVDYQPVNYYPEASAAVSAPCTGMVMILNETFSGYVYTTYQVVGGKYDHNSLAVVDLLWAAINDERPVFWPDIMGKPDLFPPAYHTHDIFLDTYAWDARIDLVDVWTQDVLLPADNFHLQSVIRHIDVLTNHLNSRHAHALELIKAHADTPTAHAETKAQAGLALLDNIPTASLADARAGQRYDLRLTVEGAEGILTDALEAYSANLMRQGILPVSRWGNLNYLEPGVSGSFEGSGQPTTTDTRPAVLEADGTLVRLRPGTNGTSIGVYYDYMLNGFADPTANQLIKTNSQYWPAAMGREYKPFLLQKSTPDVLWGYAYEVAAFPTINRKMFIAVTGESFDSSKHDVAFINTTYTHSEYGERSISERAYVTIIDGYVYCVDYNPWGNTRKVGFTLLRVSVASIKANSTVAWEMLKGWTSTGGVGGTMTGDSLYMANIETSINPADNPMILTDVDLAATLYRSSWMFYMVSDTPGVIKIAMGGIMQYYTTQLLDTQAIGFRCEVNVTARTCKWVDSPPALRTRINNGNLANISLDDNPASKLNQVQLNCAVNQGTKGGDEHGISYINYKTGYYMKSYITNILNSNIVWEIGYIANWTNKVAGWDIVGRVVTRVRRSSDSPTFGSAVNNNLMQPIGLPGNRIMMSTMDENNAIKAVRAGYGTDNTHVYNVANIGQVPGYAPTGDRINTPDRDRFYRPITYLNGATLVNAGGALNPWRSYGPVTWNADGTYDNDHEMTWTVSELNAAAIAFANTLDIAAVVLDAKCDIHIPLDTSLPIMAVVSVRYSVTGGASLRQYITGVNYSGARKGNITGYSLKTAFYYMYQHLNNNCSGLLNNRGQNPGMTIHRVGNDLLCTIGSMTQASVPGGASARFWLFAYSLTTNTFTINPRTPVMSCNPYNAGVSWYPFLVPGHGTLVLDDTLSSASYFTVLPVLPVGVTLATFNAFNSNDKTNRFIIMAQEVEQGWSVYFTEEVPVILNGREGTVPITSIDLATVKTNPANTTFYVYVEELNGVMSYRITATEELPTIKKMFIGTVVTAGSAINNINIAKRSRIGIYQVSDKNFGSSIPVSTGLPFQTGDWSMDT